MLTGLTPGRTLCGNPSMTYACVPSVPSPLKEYRHFLALVISFPYLVHTHQRSPTCSCPHAAERMHLLDYPEPTRHPRNSYSVLCLTKKNHTHNINAHQWYIACNSYQSKHT